MQCLCASETSQILSPVFFQQSILFFLFQFTLAPLPYTEVCSTVAFAPLSKNLSCGTSCAPENTSFVWKFFTVGVNATFRYGVFPHEVYGSVVRYENVKVLADGTLHIGTVKKAHQGDYSCTSSFSNGTVCGKADRTLMVTQLCKLFSLTYALITCPDFAFVYSYVRQLVTTALLEH